MKCPQGWSTKWAEFIGLPDFSPADEMIIKYHYQTTGAIKPHVFPAWRQRLHKYHDLDTRLIFEADGEFYAYFTDDTDLYKFGAKYQDADDFFWLERVMKRRWRQWRWRDRVITSGSGSTRGIEDS